MAFLTQRAARLNAGVVKFGSLTDHDRTGADHEDIAAGHAGGSGLAEMVRSAFGRSHVVCSEPYPHRAGETYVDLWL